MKHTLESRLNRARELKAAGYNCSQCVVMAFDDIHSLPDTVAQALAVGLGGGVGGQHHVCGAVSAMAVVDGFAEYAAPADKARVYSSVQTMSREFASRNGSMICSELLADRPSRKPCSHYIEEAITILHNALSAR